MNYTALYECLCTYAAKPWTKFGEVCQHYIKVEDIVRVMEVHPVNDVTASLAVVVLSFQW